MSFLWFLLYIFYANNAIIIDTKLGQIEGTTNNDSVHRFLNIPYAEPPIDELRWRPTQPLNNTWNGIYNATNWGNACVQPTATHLMASDKGVQFVEDCLYLNVFTPYKFDDAPQQLHPVLLWIHGGGLSMGTAMSATYEASPLTAHQDIVVVSINYRLGVAAYFIDPLLSDSKTGNGGANGILDMIEALKWVQNNIESFGGDKNEVTIAGESGGGWAVCGLVLSPLAKGLFKRSIQMSGSCIKSVGKFKTLQEGYKQTKILRDSLGVATIEDMRGMDMQVISDGLKWDSGEGIMPIIDGYVFPQNPLELLKQGHVNGESTMIGTVFRESFTAEPFNAGYAVQNESDLYQMYYKYFHGSQVKEIKKYYPFDEIKEKIWKYDSIFDERHALLIQTTQQTDCWVRCGSIAQTEILSNGPMTKNSFPVYFYQFGTADSPWDSVTHGFDIAHLFGNGFTSPMFTMLYNWTDVRQEFAKVGMTFFGEYIKGIGPKTDCGKDVTVQNGYYMHIVDMKVDVIDLEELDVVKERCSVWDWLGDTVFRLHQGFCLGTGDPKDYTEETVQEMMDEWEEKINAAVNASNAE